MSNTDATSLLRALSAGIRPDAAANQRPAPPVEHQSFTALLAGAINAQEPSQRSVEIEPGLGVELDQEELDRLALIIDNAEKQGSTRLAVLHEGNVLQIDVLTRTVDGVERFDADRIFTEIDSLANLGQHDQDAAPKQLSRAEALARTAAGLFGVRNESLVNLLNGVAGAIDPDQNETQSKNKSGAA